SDAEVADVQDRFGFEFPPDLRALLQTALPVSPHGQFGKTDPQPIYATGESRVYDLVDFPNWRDASSANVSKLREAIDRPLDSLLADVEHSHAWIQEWGPRPENASAAREVAQERVRAAPTLVPLISGLAYLPSTG